DCLNQFRLYGKADNRECSGVSITFNKDFFADKPKLATSSFTLEGIKPKGNDIENKSALFRCMYIDPKTKKLISVGHKEDFLLYREGKSEPQVNDYNEKIKNLIGDVFKELEKLKEQYKDLDDKILSQLFLNLRYLTKHVAFKEEQECRIIKIKNVKDTEVIMSENRRQMHLEYVDCRKYVEEIVFGKNASGMNIFQDRLLHEGLDKITCRKSDNPFA
ncbi:MAG: DUF2971 domain-containing protein, partial [Dysgonamonadaceae bacterium]|nr:DUF2971 domain-containing protein [Dysgonamonadaceae bacterium]